MEAIGYILLIIIKSPLWIAQWLFKRKGLIVVLIVGGIVLIGVNSYNKKITQTANLDTEVPAYQKIAPKTPYVIQTLSRVYYVNTYKQLTADRTILVDYYTYDTKEWKRQTSELSFKTKEIQIYKR